MIGKVFQAMLADLHLTPEQHALAPAAMRRHLMAVAGPQPHSPMQRLDSESRDFAAFDEARRDR